MRTILTATVAALLAAAITATAANQGDPVYDKAAVKQLKEIRSETERGFDDLYRVTAESCRTLSDRSWECPTPQR